MNEHLQYEYLWEFPEKMQDVILSILMATDEGDLVSSFRPPLRIGRLQNGQTGFVIYSISFSSCIWVPFRVDGWATRITKKSRMEKTQGGVERHLFADLEKRLNSMAGPALQQFFKIGSKIFAISSEMIDAD